MASPNNGSTTVTTLYSAYGMNEIQDSGALHSEMRYTAFGETRPGSGTIPTTMQYTGQRHEEDIGLYYYVARWYDPETGRFTQADTILPNPTDAQSFDRFAYVANNPLRYTDPSGHYLEGECGYAGGGCGSDSEGTPDPGDDGSGELVVIILVFSPDYSDWNSNKYSGCFKCHAAVANGQIALTNSELAQIHDPATEAFGDGGGCAFCPPPSGGEYEDEGNNAGNDQQNDEEDWTSAICGGGITQSASGATLCSVNDLVTIVIMPEGFPQQVPRSTFFTNLGYGLGFGGVVADIIELIAILTPWPGDEDAAGSFDVIITYLGCLSTGECQAHESLLPELPPVITVSQDVLIAGGDLVVGVGSTVLAIGGPVGLIASNVPDGVTTALDLIYGVWQNNPWDPKRNSISTGISIYPFHFYIFYWP